MRIVPTKEPVVQTPEPLSLQLPPSGSTQSCQTDQQFLDNISDVFDENDRMDPDEPGDEIVYVPSSQKKMGKTEFRTSEGVVRYRKIEYKLYDWIENFEHYLRSAMSYSNARTLDEFIGNADFEMITENAFNRFKK